MKGNQFKGNPESNWYWYVIVVVCVLTISIIVLGLVYWKVNLIRNRNIDTIELQRKNVEDQMNKDIVENDIIQ